MAQRRRNPFIGSARGGRVLSALQLPFFVVRPPRLYGVLTTTGRRTGKRRRRCIRVARVGDTAYLVAIKGPTTGWARNALTRPAVHLRLRDGTWSGTARRIDSSEAAAAAAAYCEDSSWFDVLTYANWRTGRPTEQAIRALLREWFQQGTPLAVDLHRRVLRQR